MPLEGTVVAGGGSCHRRGPHLLDGASALIFSDEPVMTRLDCAVLMSINIAVLKSTNPSWHGTLELHVENIRLLQICVLLSISYYLVAELRCATLYLHLIRSTYWDYELGVLQGAAPFDLREIAPASEVCQFER